MEDPYIQAEVLAERLRHTASAMGAILERPEARARPSDHDALRSLAEHAATASLRLLVVFDWAGQ